MKDFVTGAFGTMYYVRDMKKAVEYYKAIYGQAPSDEGPEWTEFDLKGTKICLHLAAPDQEIDGKGILIHNTKNLKGRLAEMKSLGVEIQNDYHEVCPGGYSVDVRDPSGNLLSFFEYVGQ